MNLARQLRKKYLLWSWKQRLAYFILAIIVSSVAFTFVFVICEVHYDENYNFQFKYCIPKDSTPHNYYYHYFTGNFEQHSFLGSWGDFHYLNMSFFSNEKEEKLIVKNREAFGDIYNFRVNLVNVEAYLQRNRPHFLKYIPQMNRVELSDYLRYLNIVVGGGIYSDVDVELVTPIRYWVSSFNYLYSFFYNVDDFDFVIGVERDDPLIYNTTYKTHKIPFQLCQWVFAGKKGSRMFARIVEGIEENVMHKMPSLRYEFLFFIFYSPCRFDSFY